MSKDEEALMEKVARAIAVATSRYGTLCEGEEPGDNWEAWILEAQSAIEAIRSSPPAGVRSAREYLAEAFEAGGFDLSAQEIRSDDDTLLRNSLRIALAAIDTAIRDSLAAGREQGVAND